MESSSKAEGIMYKLLLIRHIDTLLEGHVRTVVGGLECISGGILLLRIKVCTAVALEQATKTPE